MSHSPLATGRPIPTGGRYSARNTALVGFTNHHHAGVNAMGEATNPAREVSANYWIGNNGIAYPNIPDQYRAWTTGDPSYPAGAASDHRNITTEISNTLRGFREETWEISDKALATNINIMGERAAHYRMGVLKRALVGGVAAHRDYVKSTSCPGPYYMKHLPKIIEHAELVRQSYVAGKPRLVTHHDVAAFTGGSSEYGGDPAKATFMKGGAGGKPGMGGGKVPIPTPPKPAPPAKPQPPREWPAVALLVDGVWGPVTRRAYQTLLAGLGLYRGLLDGDFARISIIAEQTWLARLGHYRGKVDGIRGPLTIKALQAFLRSKGHYSGLIDGSHGVLTTKGLQAYFNAQAKYFKK